MMDDVRKEATERRVALVTGASRGIGRAVAIALASKGSFVWVNYSSSSGAAEETLTMCREVGGDGALVQFDVSKLEEVEAAFDRIKSEGPARLDILVNNAGITLNSLLVRTKAEDWDRVMGINLSGVFYCAKSAIKQLLKSRAGRIVNISSVVAEMGNPGQCAYVASKSAVIGFTKSLAKELGSRQITVNAVTPGFIETDMTEELPAERKAELLAQIPLARLGSAEDVANLVSFLTSEEAAYITGQVVGINGGLYM